MDACKSWGLGTTFDCHNDGGLLLALDGRREGKLNVLHCMEHSHLIQNYAIPKYIYPTQTLGLWGLPPSLDLSLGGFF